MTIGVIDVVNGRVVCEVCGKAYLAVGTHLRKHGMSTDEYKLLFGLNKRASLSSPSTTEKHREVGLQIVAKDPSWMVHGRNKGLGPNGPRRPQTVIERLSRTEVCKRGHPMSDAVVWLSTGGRFVRRCRECFNQYKRDRRRAKP